MTLIYQTVCDVCQKREEGWPDGDSDFSGWLEVRPLNSGGHSKHYCPDCAKGINQLAATIGKQAR